MADALGVVNRRQHAQDEAERHEREIGAAAEPRVQPGEKREADRRRGRGPRARERDSLSPHALTIDETCILCRPQVLIIYHRLVFTRRRLR